MKTRLARFSVALVLSLVMSSLSVLAQGKRPDNPPPENPSFVCGVLIALGVPQAALDALGCDDGGGDTGGGF